MTTRHLSLAAAALAAALAAPASAQGPCAADAQRLCQGILPGGGRIHACLKSNADRLSPACRQDLAQAQQRAREIHERCQPDVWQFCQGIRPGRGRILACLKSHEPELSPPCAEEFARAREKAQDVRAACAEDARRLCRGIAPGGGRLHACLKSNADRLSPACQQALGR